MKKLLLASIALLPLTACNWWNTPTPPIEEEEQSSAVAETKNVIYRGRLLPLGTSIYMEGTHRLELEDGRFVLLESDGILLDDYLSMDVEVFGATRPTVEGGAIIMRVERAAELSSSSSSAAESSVPSSVAASSSEGSSAAPAISSAPKPVVSSKPAPTPSSIPAPVTVSSTPAVVQPASSAASNPLAAETATMAKANLDAANWTREYCAPVNLGYCFPVHKNWWFTSFGATTSNLWHVEVGPTELEELGDGPLVIVLVSGAASVPDGQVTVDGSMAIGVRAWSNNRHIEVRAPAALEKIVRYVTQELKAAPAASSSAAQ